MQKTDFVLSLKQFKIRISEVSKKCNLVKGRRLQSISLLSDVEKTASEWFDELEPTLRNKYKLNEDKLTKYRECFGKLLELIEGRPSKKSILQLFETILSRFHQDLIVSVLKHHKSETSLPSIKKLVSHGIGLEVDYLEEASECAKFGLHRAAIILGWCAAINRLQMYIERIGFSKLNKASKRMSAISSGRYKRFKKKFDIHNLSDLRMTVFDGELLWILEFLGAIDGNQHERLSICLTMRNTCSHPGEAKVTPENLLSFFSDIDSHVFSNSKFTISQDDVETNPS